MLLKWIGGKNQLAKWFIERMPEHRHYYEVFFGAGHVFWQKPLSGTNVINDFNGKLVNMYRAIADPQDKERLKELLDNAIYSRDMFEAYQTLYDDKYKWFDLGQNFKQDGTEESKARWHDIQVQKAFVYIYMNRTSFNGQFQSFAARDDAGPLLNLSETIETMHKKMVEGKVVVENRSFEDFIPFGDKPGAFQYLDPPYWITTQTQGKKYYEKVMTADQHIDLRDSLFAIKHAKWMLSYDDVPEIRELYPEKIAGKQRLWVRSTPKLSQTAANATVGQHGIDTVMKSELLITNYDQDTIGGLFANAS